MSKAQGSLLGKLASPTDGRDAVHIAIIPVQAAGLLVPGQKVALTKDRRAYSCYSKESVGVVDPFLDVPVEEGQWFLLCLYPNTVTSLRHHWEHPLFKDVPVADSPAPTERKLSTPTVDEAVNWLSDFANSVGLSYEEIMEGAVNFLETGMPYSNGSRTETARDDMYEGITAKEFWRNFCVVTNRPTNGREDNPFSCSC